MGKTVLPPPRVVIDLESWQKVMEYARQCEVEINGFGVVDYDRAANTLRVSNIFITKQTAASFIVCVDDDDLHAHMYKLLQEGVPVGQICFQWHSHIDMETYFSDVDKANIERWAGDYLISLVVNQRGEWKCRLDIYKPFRIGYEVDVVVEWPHADAEIQSQVKGEIEKKVTKVTQKPKRLVRFGVKNGVGPYGQ